ncbi:unnamed protein product [Trifolium pratense]|uniref:Uncharacterized protein n=1 Tax=Trifolium pratense TaxID=57577 RepID=A0ACB0IXK1_TRIPR|nr:unnamed protein product [Trifolium pratense]
MLGLKISMLTRLESKNSEQEKQQEQVEEQEQKAYSKFLSISIHQSSVVHELESKKEAPHKGEGEGSSSVVDELENLEKDSKDDSPYQPWS